MSRSSIREKGCPLCGQAAAPEHTPFCGRGCRDRDLLQWLGDGYALPGRPATDEGLDSPRDTPL